MYVKDKRKQDDKDGGKPNAVRRDKSDKGRDEHRRRIKQNERE